MEFVTQTAKDNKMAIAWASGVNTDAYGMETDGGDNVERVEFESGKKQNVPEDREEKAQTTFGLVHKVYSTRRRRSDSLK